MECKWPFRYKLTLGGKVEVQILWRRKKFWLFPRELIEEIGTFDFWWCSFTTSLWLCFLDQFVVWENHSCQFANFSTSIQHETARDDPCNVSEGFLSPLLVSKSTFGFLSAPAIKINHFQKYESQTYIFCIGIVTGVFWRRFLWLDKFLTRWLCSLWLYFLCLKFHYDKSHK